MLTKNVKFDDDVLDVIKKIEWSSDGLKAVLVGSLDRTLYVSVNKALEIMGGKWNRKDKAHIFEKDPRPFVEGLLDNGSLMVERDGFFETPKEIVEQMIELGNVEAGDEVLEPSAGRGAIAFILDALGADVFCVEKNIDRSEFLNSKNIACINKDFLEFDTESRFHSVIMNPPFEEGQDALHVMHAFNFLRDGGKLVSVMGEGVFFRKDKKSVAFRKWLEDKGGYSLELPQGSFKESGTGVSTRLVIIEK